MILYVPRRNRPVIRLAKVEETSSGLTWIFHFIDPVHRFAQSIIFPKQADPHAMEACYERLWEKWVEQIRETDWKEGRAG